MLVVAKGGKGGNCSATGCLLDLNGACPPQLRGDGGVGCRSACEAFGDPQYCCSGAFGTPDLATCKCRLLTAIGVSRLPQEVFCISPALKGFNFYCQSNTCKFSKALNFKYVQLECSNKLKAFVFHSIHTNHSQKMF
ncbi:hypothetical protein Godav_005297 [Gossypium davidsonii]|uniref:Uncharacterized protein n=1 Tax=Gossypium davidsonii TaxID=34287 RepID=A0A7J8TBR3_GOSDV|nr:hypothetical protein [Gossypium davidsonii]